jgi:hypothetical protein
LNKINITILDRYDGVHLEVYTDIGQIDSMTSPLNSDDIKDTIYHLEDIIMTLSKKLRK